MGYPDHTMSCDVRTASANRKPASLSEHRGFKLEKKKEDDRYGARQKETAYTEGFHTEI